MEEKKKKTKNKELDLRLGLEPNDESQPGVEMLADSLHELDSIRHSANRESSLMYDTHTHTG